MATSIPTKPATGILAQVERHFGPLDPRLAKAFEGVPWEVFEEADRLGIDRDDRQRLVREGRLPPSPEVVARMLTALQPGPAHRVLVVGCGTGYATALLSRICVEVYAVDELGSTAETARRTLAALGLVNARVKRGDASTWKAQGPFDRILVPPGGGAAPESLRQQLSEGGRLLMPLGQRRARQALVAVTRRGVDAFLEERLGELRFRKRLGDLLVEAGVCGRTTLEQAALEALSGSRPLGEVLLRGERIHERDLARALARQRDLACATLDELIPRLDPDVARGVPRKYLEHHHVIPIRRENGRVEVATADPDVDAGELSKLFSPDAVELRVVTASEYGRLWSALDLMETSPRPLEVPETPPEELGVQGPHTLEARFVDLTESMLLEAIGERASDIHLERYGDRIRVRLRVDGDLRDMERYRLTPVDLAGVVNVVKIRANLDITERRLPQGGRIRVKAKGQTFDLRVQVQPSLYGEHVVIRLLPQNVKLLTVEDLGFDPGLAADFRRLLDHPSGLLLVVGPTGSGKTTTLYAGLQILAADLTRKVITVEDPIEYAIENVQQTGVRPEIGFSFADAMRSFVRQDPDVILVGEIRDSETALEAIRASQTGHLVLSTLHCNDSTDAVQRLLDLKMHPNSISSELLAVMSQRLAKRICEGCRRPDRPDPDLLRAIFPKGPPADFSCWKGEGCPRCGGHGTFGRIACVEFLLANPEIRETVAKGPTVGELRRLALRTRFTPMRTSALALVQRGAVAISELPLMLSWERLGPET